MDNVTRIETAEGAKSEAEYKKTLVELLYQLADDDYIFSYRGSEWLGLAPHIEADVAFSSINQDMMGHAVMLFSMLEELGEQPADHLAHLRDAGSYRNAVMLEKENGPGVYNVKPRYDWAYAVIRSYFYQIFKQIRYQSLLTSSYTPLVQASTKILREQLYHIIHWEGWIKQLTGTEEGKARLIEGIRKTWPDVAGLFSYGDIEQNVNSFGLNLSSEHIKEKWLQITREKFDAVGLQLPQELTEIKDDGRKGQHTPALQQAINTLSEVYRLDPAADW